MQIHKPGLLNSAGKRFATMLSSLFANRYTEKLTRLMEAYLCILLGKGAGTGWAIASEMEAAHQAIASVHSLSTVGGFDSAEKAQSMSHMYSGAVAQDANFEDQLTIFDVGANVGNWSYEIKARYPSAKLYLFEPQPNCTDQLRQRFADDVTIVQKAVTSVDDMLVKLHMSQSDDEIASLHARGDSYFQNHVFSTSQAQTTTIDAFVNQNSIERIDLLKLDIEGHELMALQGASDCMERGIIRSLTFEFGSGNINSRTFFRDFWELLTSNGFHIYRILPSGRMMHIREYYEDCEYFRGVTNYLATLKML